MEGRRVAERVVAGLRCGEVLANLSDYLDGELPRERAQKIEAHLRGCDVCERFGGELAAIIGDLRAALAEPAPVADDIARRLRERLRAERGG